jgi:type II secretory pathway pseudopilin PulG
MRSAQHSKFQEPDETGRLAGDLSGDAASCGSRSDEARFRPADRVSPKPTRLGRGAFEPAGRSPEAAFTMVEIALSLGVIAIALVAIIGVLPTGVRVQKDNREDTILNQEGLFWVEAIRSGSRGLDYLTNAVDSITISNAAAVTNFYNPANAGTTGNNPGLTNGQAIIELLTVPKVVFLTQGQLTNRVTARVRALSGSAAEKSKAARDMAFAYQLVSEVVPLRVYPPDYMRTDLPGLSDPEKVARTNLLHLEANRANNFEELRLTLQGPVIPRGSGYEVLGTPRVFRTLISGTLTATNLLGRLVRPSTFVQVP